jgi:threonine/homoserine/homoserine lactone efflux protein
VPIIDNGVVACSVAVDTTPRSRLRSGFLFTQTITAQFIDNPHSEDEWALPLVIALSVTIAAAIIVISLWSTLRDLIRRRIRTFRTFIER